MKILIIKRASGLAFLATLFLVATAQAGGNGARLFWTDKDDGQLEASDSDGGNRVTLLSGLADPRGIAVDTANNKIYWASHEPSGAIFTADCDGTNVQTFLSSVPEPADIALDLSNGQIYWVEQSFNQICRASLTPPVVPEIVISGLSEPYYIAIDSDGGFLYWSDFNSTIIHRSTIDGANPTNFITGQSRVRDIELADGKIYWCDRNSNQIRSRDINGTGGGQILFSGAGDSLDRPHGLCLDPETGTMFWTDTRTDEINSGAMNGSGSVSSLVSTSLTGAWGIAVSKPVPSPYETWLTLYFTETELNNPANEALLWGELADPDLDGRLNLLEFGQGTSPLDPAGDPEALQLSIVEESGEQFLQLVFRLRKDDSALDHVVESSDSLDGTWQVDQFTEVPPRSADPGDAAYEFVTVRSPPIPGDASALFARLGVSR